jgi:hypothetical protein
VTERFSRPSVSRLVKSQHAGKTAIELECSGLFFMFRYSYPDMASLDQRFFSGVWHLSVSWR